MQSTARKKEKKRIFLILFLVILVTEAVSILFL